MEWREKKEAKIVDGEDKKEIEKVKGKEAEKIDNQIKRPKD